MTKTDIFSGFLGAGKTTLIRKLISEAYKGEKLVLIENEFGEIAIDGGFLKDAGVEITEMNSGCICCTLVGDFTTALKKVIDDYSPDRIIIEPSGVGKLSDVAKAVSQVEGIEIGSKVTVVDAGKCKMYMRNFGEFFNDQVENADLVVLSRTDTANEKKTADAVEIIRELNHDCGLITTPWDSVNGALILDAMTENGLKRSMEELEHEHEEHECHHHHEHEHDHECHHHEHEEGHPCHEGHECEHHHEHHHDHDHEHDEHCECGCHDHEEHEHHHGHDEHCECGCHEHDHEGHEHHHHHADEIFTSWGTETPRKFTEAELSSILESLQDEEKFGIVLRAKGFVDSSDGEWIYFDYVPGESDIRRGAPAVTGRFCVIGSKLKEDALKELFNIA
jgi:Putative GTPases (G3E family)